VLQRDYSVESFERVISAGPQLVLVSVGGRQSVRGEGVSATLDKLEAVVVDGALQIRPKAQYRTHFDWRGERATFYVSLPRLDGATVAGSGDIRVDRVSGKAFAGTVAGSGNLDIAALRVGNADLTVSGSGSLTAHGSADNAQVSVAGSGSVRASGVASRTAAVAVTGSGDAQLTASGDTTVSIIGSGNADIAGTPRCTVTRMGSGHARCRA
jgi:hypothetical protein